MTERIYAGIYVAVTGALALAALPLLAWVTSGFDATDPRWWQWLWAYFKATRQVPPVIQWNVLGVVAGAALVLALNPFSFRFTEYGGACFASRSMFRRMGLTARSGIVLGRVGRRLLVYDRPLSTLLLAPPGAGKTAGVVIPTLLSFRGSVVVNDPKGEAFDRTAGWRAREGQVYRIEWNNPKGTRWNPLSPLSLPADPAELEIAVDRLTAIFIEPTKGMGDSFFEKAARDALSSIALFHIYEGKRQGDEATFARILSWMAVDRAPSGDEEPDDPIAAHYQRAAGVAEAEQYPRRIIDGLRSLANMNYRTRADVIKTVETGLRVFRNAAVAKATSRSDFDIRALRTGKKPVSVYIVVPPANADVFGAITGALFELAGQMAVSSQGHPMLFLLDEVPEMPPLNIVKRGPAIGRGQGVRFVIVAQDNGQLIERYGKEGFDTIITTTAYKVVLTQNHPDTQAMISRMIGNTTRRRISRTAQAGNGLLFRRSTSVSLEGVPLVRPEDLGSMRQGHQYVIAQEFMRHPIRSRSAFYFRIRRFRRRSAIQPPRRPSMAP